MKMKGDESNSKKKKKTTREEESQNQRNVVVSSYSSVSENSVGGHPALHHNNYDPVTEIIMIGYQ